jgi:hypothetical protein
VLSHTKRKENAMQIRVSKNGGKRRTWLIGCKKKVKIKDVVDSSGNAWREVEKKRCMIVRNTEKGERRENA